MGTTKGKRTTAADIAAAVALGAMAADATVTMDGDDSGADDAPTQTAERVTANPSGAHECAIPGCRHGAAHGATVQPDRQVKLQCPGCGAVARMTVGALAKGLGITCHRDNVAYAPAERRTYTKRA